jgi:NagD protein
MPDAGAIIALIEKSAGRIPDTVIGKPYAPMAEYVFDFCGVTADKVAFVGDRLYTDMKFALNNGMTSVLVLSGETDKKSAFRQRNENRLRFRNGQRTA